MMKKWGNSEADYNRLEDVEIWRCVDVENQRLCDMEIWRCVDVENQRLYDVEIWRCMDVGKRRLKNFHFQPQFNVNPTSETDVSITSKQPILSAGLCR